MNETNKPDVEEKDWANGTLAELADYILERHHRYMEQLLPRFLKLMESTESEATGQSRNLIKSLRHFSLLLTEGYAPHALREENLLFPYIRELEAYAEDDKNRPGEAASGGFAFKSMASIDNEHNQIMDTLARMKAKEIIDLMADEIPEPLRELQKLVVEIANDLSAHTKIEDTFLFPRAVELERKLDLHK